jgi:antitoxin component of MazEF toxin-antitoxin module
MTNLKFRPRKIHKVNYSRVLTMPVLWLENVGIDFGDSVDLEIGPNNELIITPHKEGQDV